ncbi:MAG: carbohydrate ABC transporter permease, partial [Cyanobacteria bacterium J149]
MGNKKTLIQIITIYILLIIIALAMLFPLFWLLSTSFKSAG